MSNAMRYPSTPLPWRDLTDVMYISEDKEDIVFKQRDYDCILRSVNQRPRMLAVLRMYASLEGGIEQQAKDLLVGLGEWV